MPIGSTGDYLGLLSLFSFALSVIAAVLAIDMYRLLRTGQFGTSWRVIIICTVIYAWIQAVRMAEFFDWKALNSYGFSQIAELVFALALAYSIYLQRKTFGDVASLRGKKNDDRDYADGREEIPTYAVDSAIETDWSRLDATSPLEANENMTHPASPPGSPVINRNIR